MGRQHVPFLFIVLFILLFNPAAGFCGTPLELTLNEAIDTALKENLDLRSAGLDRKIAGTEIGVNEGAFDPNFKLSMDNKYIRRPPGSLIAGTDEQTYAAEAGISGKLFYGTGYELKWTNQRYKSNSIFYSTAPFIPSDFLVINPSYSSDLILSVTQPLLKDAGKDIQKSRLNVAGANFEISSLRLSEGADRIIADTTKAYWDLLSARMDLEVSELSLKLAAELLNEVKAKIRAGALAPSEIYKAEAEVSLREEALIRNRKLISDAGDALRVILNMKDWDRDLTPVERPPALSDPAPLESLVAAAMSGRKDLKAAMMEKKNREVLRKFYENQALPDLSIIGAAGLNGLDRNYGDALDRLSSGRYHSWQIGLALTVPLGNKTAESNALKARHEEEKSEISLRQKEQKIESEVREAWRSVKLSIESFGAAGKTRLAAEKRLDAENVRFRAGMAVITDVLRFQEEYARTIAAEKNARIGYAKALVELDRVTGALSKAQTISQAIK